MIITYFRSSSYVNLDFCEQQYYLTYVLGMRSPAGKRAVIGTIVHKVMECLAGAKLCKQSGREWFQDDALGKLFVVDCSPNLLAERAYAWYTTSEPHLEWKAADLKECKQLSASALTDFGGRFDPRKRRIIDPERHFDFLLPYDWAKYSYDTPNGKIEGQLGLKGTIDLITEYRPGVIEIIDWKTGMRKDWATGKEKDFEKLSNDPQLRIYHYAASKLYPQAKQIIITIYWVRDGGPFTICFHQQDLAVTERLLKNRFKRVREIIRPKLNKSWKCTRICHFGKTLWPNSEKTICQHIHDETMEKGMKYVDAHFTRPGHTVAHYESPG